jgi:hypothetical protein
VDPRLCSAALEQLLAQYPCCPSFPAPWDGIAPSPDCRSTDCNPDEVVALLRAAFSDSVLRSACILVGPEDESPRLHPSLCSSEGGLLIAIRNSTGQQVVDLLTPCGSLSGTAAPLFVVITPAAGGPGTELPMGRDDLDGADDAHRPIQAAHSEQPGHLGKLGQGTSTIFAATCPLQAALYHSIGVTTLLFDGLDNFSYQQWRDLDLWQPMISAVPGCLTIVSPCDAPEEAPATVEFPVDVPAEVPQGSDGTSGEGQPVMDAPPGRHSPKAVMAAAGASSLPGMRRAKVPELVFAGCDLFDLSANVPAQVLATLEMLRDGAQSLRTEFDDWLQILVLTELDFDDLHWLLQFRTPHPIREWFGCADDCPRMGLDKFLKQFAPAEPPPTLVEARSRLVAALCDSDGACFHGSGYYRRLDADYIGAVERECVNPLLNKAEHAHDPVAGETYRQLAAAARRIHRLEPYLSIKRIPDELYRDLGTGKESIQESYDAWQKRFADLHGKFFQKQKAGYR